MHDLKTKENKERESGNMNSKGEIWKQTESQRGKTHKNRNPTLNKQDKRNTMNQNKGRKQKTKHTLEKLFFQDFHGKQVGHHELRYFPPGTKT